MLKKAYIEISNVCNLRCAFCPGTTREKRVMSALEFSAAADRLRGHVRFIYLHLMGEPLLHPELGDILRIASEKDFRVCLTTNGTLLSACRGTLLHAPALHKVSVSLHSFEGNHASEDMRDYLSSVWDFCAEASQKGIICALRLWNEGGLSSRNGEVLDFLHEKTNRAAWDEVRGGSLRLGENLYLESAEKFDWPDLSAAPVHTEFCYGLRDQIGILADGTVVPCCLDHNGDIPLGNIFSQTLDEILASPRAKALYDGFSNRRPREALCLRCGYAGRFNAAH